MATLPGILSAGLGAATTPLPLNTASAWLNLKFDANPAASPEPVLAWNQTSLDLVGRASAGPTPSSRLYALLNSALYDAWALFDAKAIPSLSQSPAKLAITQLLNQAPAPSLTATAAVAPASQPTVPLQPLPLRQAVMAVAASNVLRDVGPSLFKTGFLPLDLVAAIEAQRQQALDALNLGGSTVSPLAEVAVTLGTQVSDAIHTAALLDGSNQQNAYADTSGYQPNIEPPSPGQIPKSWQPLPGQVALTPHWGNVKPFAVGKELVPNSILTPYIGGVLNPAFVAEMNQVQQLSMHLTPQQKAIADFWEDGSGTSYPPGTWIGFTNDLIRDRNLGLDQAVKLSFTVGQAVFDAGIATWATKFKFDSVRPISAIRSYYAGRSITDAGEVLSDWRGKPIVGELWTPYIPTPRFPDVASGHSTFSTAAATVLRNLLGSNLFSKTVPQSYRNSDGSTGVEMLRFSTLSGTAEQAGFSRLLGGIHMNDGNWKGQKIGTQVGAIVTNKAESLFNGGAAQDVYRQQFGSMDADVLTGQEAPDSRSIMEVYGLGGDDVLISCVNSRQSLYGGDGVDHFRLQGGRAVSIRDLEVGETIEVRAPLSNLQLGPSKLGSQFTDLSTNGKLLAHLDGQWSADQIHFANWV